jgi:hypothetical protein
MIPSSSTSTTPAKRIARLLGEGVRILAVHGSGPGIDVTHDITGLLDALSKSGSLPAEAPTDPTTEPSADTHPSEASDGEEA